MVYKYKEYSPKFSIEFDSIRKNIALKKYVNFIFSLINSKKYPSIESFYSSNRNFDTFIQLYLSLNGANPSKYKSSTFVHFKETMTENDYQRMIKSIFELTNAKRQFDSQNISEQSFDDKKIVTYENGDKSFHLIERDDNNFIKKLENKQNQRDTFQTTDSKENALNMFNDLSANVNETLKLVPLNELISNMDTLSEADVSFIRRVLNQINDMDEIKIDIGKKIVIGKDNEVISIKDESQNEEIDVPLDNSMKKGYQKVLSNANSISTNYDYEN